MILIDFIYLFICLFNFWTLCLHFGISGSFQISQISLFQTDYFN